jgi:hypothetical protein
MLQSVHDRVVDPMLLFMSGEAWFHLSGFMTAQNASHWDTESLYTIHEGLIYDQKVGMFCVISGRRIIAPLPLKCSLKKRSSMHTFSRITQQPTHHNVLWRPFVKYLVKG